MILSIVVLVAVLLLGGGAVYYLQFVILAEKQAELDQVSKQLDEANAKVAKIGDLKKEIENLEKDEKAKLEKIPNLDRLEYDTFANLLDLLRKRSGVFVSRAAWFNFKPTTTQGRTPKTYPQAIHRVQYDLTVTGGFYQLLKYIHLLEEQRRVINIDNLTLSPRAASGSDKGAALMRDMKVTVYSFTYRQPEQLPEIQRPQRIYSKTTPIPE
jgi:Tfp pilus assembly protein PilO